MYIQKLHISNIRSLKRVQMEWEAGKEAGWHVVIGDNGAGKTTLLQSISLALIGDKRAQMLRQKWSNWVRLEENEAEIKLTLISDQQKNVATDHLVFKKIKNEEPTFLRSEWSFNLSADDGKYPENWNHEKEKGWFSAAYGAFRRFHGGDKKWANVFDISPKLAAHISCLEEEDNLSVLDWVRLLIEKSEEDKEAAQLLELLKIAINTEGLLPEKTQLLEIKYSGIWFKDPQGKKIEISQLSNGYASILSMTFDLIFRLVVAYKEARVLEYFKNGNFVCDLPGVVLIDEIDIHLHPTWQVKIGNWFQRYFPKIQFIVTTHSPLICRACGKNGTIWRLSKDSSKKQPILIVGTEREQLVYGNILDAYGTTVFGKQIERSSESQKMLEELAQLNRLSFMKTIDKQQKKRRSELLKIFASDEATNY